MKPQRIQLSRTKGWTMPPNTVNVARPTRWGNPFFVSRWRDAKTCVALFEDAMRGIWNPGTSAHLPQAWAGYDEHQQWLNKQAAHPLDAVIELRGKNLACWCKLDQPCHADVLLRLANPQTSGSSAPGARPVTPDHGGTMSTQPGIQIIELGGADEASAPSWHLRKIMQADADGPANAKCSTTEAIMVALALCNRAYLPDGLQETHAGHLWWRLDDAQRAAIQAYVKTLSKGGPDASAGRRC